MRAVFLACLCLALLGANGRPSMKITVTEIKLTASSTHWGRPKGSTTTRIYHERDQVLLEKSRESPEPVLSSELGLYKTTREPIQAAAFEELTALLAKLDFWAFQPTYSAEGKFDGATTYSLYVKSDHSKKPEYAVSHYGGSDITFEPLARIVSVIQALGTGHLKP